MAWTESRVFTQWPLQTLQVAATGYTGLGNDTVKAALFNNSVIPDRDAAVTSTGYNTGTWLASNEVTDATNWVAGGRALTGKTFSSPGSGQAVFSAANLAGGGTVTLANAYGCLVYDDSISGGTVADQGVCFNYFGGAQSVTAGTFTIVWGANGILRYTV